MTTHERKNAPPAVRGHPRPPPSTATNKPNRQTARNKRDQEQRLKNVGPITRQRLVEHLEARPGPQRLVEDLDLDRPGVAGRVHRLAEAAQLDAPVPGRPRPSSTPAGSGVTQSATWKQAIRRSRPGPRDLLPHLRRPTTGGRCRRTTPTASAGYGAARSSACSRVDTTQRSEANIGCSGSMASRTPGGQGVRDQLADRVADVGTGRVDVPAAGRQAAGDQHQHRGAERRRLVDGALVLVVPAGLLEEAAAAQRGDGQPGVAHQRGRVLHARTPGRPRATGRRR